MLLIGMISFTVMGSTPPSEQKTKAKIEKDYQVTEFVGTVLSYEIASTDVVLLQNGDFITFEVKSNAKPNHSAILVDVGWQSNKRYFKQIPYTEKLLENYNLNFKDKLLFSADCIRDNC